MSLVRVVRNQPGLNYNSRKETIHERAHMFMDGKTLRLNGPKYASIAEGRVEDINTAYAGAWYDIRLIVFVQVGAWWRQTYRREDWYVTFLDPGRDHEQSE